MIDASTDSALEAELRNILEGPRWALVYKDLPRLVDRVQIRDPAGTLRRPTQRQPPPPPAVVVVEPITTNTDTTTTTDTTNTNTATAAAPTAAYGGEALLAEPSEVPVYATHPSHVQAEGVGVASSTSLEEPLLSTTNTTTAAGSDVSINSSFEKSLVDTTTIPTTTAAGDVDIQQQQSDSSTLSGVTATQLLVDVAARLEHPSVVKALLEAIATNPDLALGNSAAIKFLIESVLTQQSRTARLVRAINQSVVITGTWYLHQNLLAPAGVQVKDVRGAEGWRVLLDFHKDKAMYVTHVRREQSLPSSTDAFELEWSIHLSFDGDATFQGAMLKLLTFEIAQHHPSMTQNRVRQLMSRFCNGHEMVLEQTLAAPVSLPVGTTPPPTTTTGGTGGTTGGTTTTLAATLLTGSSPVPPNLHSPLQYSSLSKSLKQRDGVLPMAGSQSGYSGSAAATANNLSSTGLSSDEGITAPSIAAPFTPSTTAFYSLPRSAARPIPPRGPSSLLASKKSSNMPIPITVATLPEFSSSPLPSPSVFFALSAKEDAIPDPLVLDRMAIAIKTEATTEATAAAQLPVQYPTPSTEFLSLPCSVSVEDVFADRPILVHNDTRATFATVSSTSLPFSSGPSDTLAAAYMHPLPMPSSAATLFPREPLAEEQPPNFALPYKAGLASIEAESFPAPPTQLEHKTTSHIPISTLASPLLVPALQHGHYRSQEEASIPGSESPLTRSPVRSRIKSFLSWLKSSPNGHAQHHSKRPSG
ncbi:hypothetical protein BSLG_000079 [Batrachochytrium salamandrivorans]|nr:hypothetical protein BSLG_000079 [Batrachochytrium salamandrivorans]